MKSNLLLSLFFICFFTELSVSQTWVSTYNGAGNSNDEQSAICVDDSGNVYATGFTTGSNLNLDITTVKFSPSGIVQWAMTYNGSGNSDDRAFGIIMDDNGFIYVAGSATTGVNNGEDVILLKYNAAGTILWTRTFNNGGSSSDRALGIVVDNSVGYIFLTGYTRSGNNYDYLTLKYRDDGVFKWSKTYDRGSSSDDRAIGIVVDSYGNVIVTGSSEGNTSSFDYYTIRYDTDGLILWSKRYNGTNNGEDRAHGIVVDSYNNYTITGYSLRNTSPDSRDIATIQYDKNGGVKWTKIYNGPDNLSDNAFGITVDGPGNIYIAGSSGRIQNEEDFTTIKYSNTGVEKWAAFYNSGERTSDIAYDIKVSSTGNEIFVAGSGISGVSEKIEVAKYNSNGELMQNIQYPGFGRANCLRLNNQNNVFLGGFYSNSANSLLPNYDYISMEFQGGIITITGISGNNNNIPVEYQLFQNYPNPFNPNTMIVFDIPEASFVELTIYDHLGREISKLVSSFERPGRHSVSYDGENLGSGIYFYKLTAGTYSQTRKMVLIK